MEQQLFTVTVFTENQAGLLNQISVIFYRRGLNIESLSVSPSSIEGIHKFTITCLSNRAMMERVVKQIEKRIDVLRAFLYTDDEIVYQEVALYKVPTLQLLDDTSVEDFTVNQPGKSGEAPKPPTCSCTSLKNPKRRLRPRLK